MPHRNGRFRLIVATEPRSYRDVLAGVLEESHPQGIVVSVDPKQLERTLRRWPGALVVCSEVTPAVSELAGAWLQLAGNGEVAASSAADTQAIAYRVGLDGVLDAVKTAETHLAHLR
jgi:hypothetical protein